MPRAETTRSCWWHATSAANPPQSRGPVPPAGALTVGPLRPVVLRLAAPAVAMMACHFSFNLIDSIWVGRLIGPAALRRGLIRIAAPDWRALPAVIRVGAPLSISGVLLSGVYMWLTRFTSRFGTPALAALGIGHKIEGIGFIAISGFALAASALVAQNLGAGQEARAREAVRLVVRYCLAVTVTTAVAFLVIPATFVGLFTSDPEVIADGVLYLRVIAFAQIGQSFELILEGALAGAGYTFWPQVTSTSLTALRVPLAAWWSGVWGLLGIWIALSVTAVVRGIAMIVFWKGGRWRAARV